MAKSINDLEVALEELEGTAEMSKAFAKRRELMKRIREKEARLLEAGNAGYAAHETFLDEQLAPVKPAAKGKVKRKANGHDAEATVQ